MIDWAGARRHHPCLAVQNCQWVLSDCGVVLVWLVLLGVTVLHSNLYASAYSLSRFPRPSFFAWGSNCSDSTHALRKVTGTLEVTPLDALK